ncbi:MAG: transcriptional regulator, LacI family [Acidobacteriaceae bacterium]|nr:transcriptional regulator, LacI family [Acidobacteriaceae bacterium]
MTVRMKDIATDLNLSKMTISKVLRGQMDVSAKTKARVLQRMKELNYRPNISARSLRTGQTLSIGLIVPSLADPIYTDMARSVVKHLRLANYSVLLSSAEFEPDLERREIEQQLSRQVDALILASVQKSDELVELTRTIQTPLVHLYPGSVLFKSNAVDLHEEEIGHLAASHLVRVGCRRIANVRGPESVASDLRYKGFRAALSEVGQRVRPELTTEADALPAEDYERGVLAAERFLKSKVQPDGIVCHTDLIALGVMDRLSDAGRNIPNEIAVIGCGNDPKLCEMRIPLSSVDFSLGEIGEQTAKLVLKLLASNGPSKVKSVEVSPTLVVRASTSRLDKLSTDRGRR